VILRQAALKANPTALEASIVPNPISGHDTYTCHLDSKIIFLSIAPTEMQSMFLRCDWLENSYHTPGEFTVLLLFGLNRL